MNKRIVSAIVLAGMITSTSAFASRARQTVMGTGGAAAVSGLGSFYYDHAYNFFYNPAYINDYKNWVIVEKANGGGDASFGFVSSMMNFNMGLFFNREGGTAPLTQAGAARNMRPIDLMIGGDAGVKWGLGIQYAGNDNTGGAVTDKSTDMSVRLGASFSGLDPFVNYRVIGKDENGAGTDTGEYDGYGVGARYHFGEWTPYAHYGMNEAKALPSGVKSEATTLTVGIGRESKLAEGARLVYALYYQSTKTESTAPGSAAEVSSNTLPLEMAVEADALSWLTIRGGVSHSIMTKGVANQTLARIGGTFHVGKVDLDYAFGNTGATPTVADGQNLGFDSDTFHQVAMRYSW